MLLQPIEAHELKSQLTCRLGLAVALLKLHGRHRSTSASGHQAVLVVVALGARVDGRGGAH